MKATDRPESTTHPFSRRQFLAATGVTTTGLVAGCLGDGDGDGDGTPADGDGDDGGAGMQTDLSFISGPPDSLAFGMGNAMSSVVRDNSDLTLNVKSGTSGNAVSAVARGEEDLGWGTTLIGIQAMNEEGPFDGVEFPRTILQMPSFYFLGVAGFAKTSTDIETFADIAGQSLAPGPSGASYWGVWELALEKAMDMTNLEIVNSDVGQLADILSSDRAPVAGGPSYVNGTVPGFMQQVISQSDVRMLTWQDETMQAIQDDPRTPGRMVSNDNFGDVTEFASPDETFIVMANYVMWTSDAVGQDTIYTLLKTASDNQEALAEAHAAYTPWAEDGWHSQLMTPEVPVHPGAAEFLREIGEWSDEFTEGSI